MIGILCYMVSYNLNFVNFPPDKGEYVKVGLWNLLNVYYLYCALVYSNQHRDKSYNKLQNEAEYN